MRAAKDGLHFRLSYRVANLPVLCLYPHGLSCGTNAIVIGRCFARRPYLGLVPLSHNLSRGTKGIIFKQVWHTAQILTPFMPLLSY